MKKLFTTAAAAVSTLLFAAPAFAQELNPCGNTGGFSTLCSVTNAEGVDQFIGNVVVLLLVVAVLIALFFLIWGGIKWIMSGGDKAKVDAARSTIIGAIVGLIIAFLAFFIVTVVLRLFGLSFDNLVLPNLLGA